MTIARPRRARSTHREPLASDPLWFKNAIIYEVPVRAFADSDGDGVGDFRGLTSKLDYLQELGVSALWLLPFYPSPGRDGGYDIADYENVNPAYGTMDDFKRLLDEAHARGLRIITELVINHTSSEHAWFQRARRAPPGSPERDFYVWSDTPDRYRNTRIIFKDFETSNWSWDPVANAYYWHRFYAHQPDLNFDNPAVHEAVLRVLELWLDLGVDGMRLDAVPYLFEREGTSCENLPETHAFLKKFRAHIDARYQDRMLLAEANQWPVDAAAYFGDGDECHMNFHFPLMPRMFMSVQMEDRFPIIDILRQTPALPPGCQWATFLRNHDELTLEMVTDEERDYMYRVYTEDPVARINLGIRRRLAPLLKSRRTVELMNALLFALPGTPVLYYGDEIGMGDNVYLGDRDGVRTPMQWSSDRNAGFSRANPQRLYLPVIIDPEYHYESVNVEAQEANPASLLWWMKRSIDLRRQHPAFGRGDIEFLSPENPRVLAFIRDDGTERLLVVANLSRFTQYCELDLARSAGMTPIELFGRSQFPVVTERPYPLTLGQHGFYWFVLARPEASGDRAVPVLHAPAAWTDVLADRRRLGEILASYASERRWFRGKARVRRAASVHDVLALPSGAEVHQFVILEVEYTAGEPERYLVPLAFVSGEQAMHLEQSVPHAVVAHVERGGAAPVRGVLYDSLATGDAASALLAGLRGGPPGQGELGAVTFTAGEALRECCGEDELSGRAVRFEQSNSTVPFGDKLMIKVFRQLEPGVNAEIEVGDYLTAHCPGVAPRVLGAVSYDEAGAEPTAVAVAHAFVANQGTAWDLFSSHLEGLFDRVLAQRPAAPPLPAGDVFDRAGLEVPAAVAELLAGDVRLARRVGVRTGEIHALFGRGLERDFVPEAFTPMYQQSLFQGARSLLVRTGETLGRTRSTLPPEVRADADALLAAQGRIEERLRGVAAHLLDAVRVRAHGDLHLGQVLYTGDDFMLIDFEGEPARPLRERRYKRSPLRDVAGMLRSFSYAAEAALSRGRQRSQDVDRLRPWAAHWVAWMGAAFVAGYLEVQGVEAALPRSLDDCRRLLDFYTIEKCIYEVNYELNNRPDWLAVPIRGLLEHLATPAVRP